ncbi:MAG TPA: MobQ family relaxase [Verrucomicrobiae bacterium]|nr:MobQ family relaxase [Verrucomicrobiae bacterium]
MAIYRLEAKIFSREKRGRSVIAAAAYRAGSKLVDEIRQKTFDYTRRTKGVVETTLLLPEAAPAWAMNPSSLWNKVERVEKRVDAQLAREFILACPKELDAKSQFELAVSWAQSELVNNGMVAEVSLHHPKNGKNPHVHILCTMRKIEGDNFSAKKPREWNDVSLLVRQRESWANAVNAALEKAGRDERVDHRSLKDRGLGDVIPQPKIGVAATAMHRKGLLADPDRFQLVRYIRSLNEVRPWARAIEKAGEVHQHGMGKTWWERSLIFMAEKTQAVRETVMDTWRTLLNTRQPRSHDAGPRNDGPEQSR